MLEYTINNFNPKPNILIAIVNALKIKEENKWYQLNNK